MTEQQRKLSFLEVRNIGIEKQAKEGIRNIKVGQLRAFLFENGFDEVCIFCGASLSKSRSGYFCSLNCRNEFFDRFWWSMVRQKYIEQHPLCEVCLSIRQAFASDVHHKIPVRANAILGVFGSIWDESNLISLCERHHQEADNKNHDEVKHIIKRKRNKTREITEFI